jgi:DNA-binding response OmpR family regulator
MATILVVDDDPDLVDACRLVLEREGHEVLTAANRRAGIRVRDGREPDLIILDIMMDQPDDGISMARELRRAAFQGPIIMLTSLSKVSGLEYGADDELVPVDEFIEKPVAPSVLVATVTDLLARSQH